MNRLVTGGGASENYAKIIQKNQPNCEILEAIYQNQPGSFSNEVILAIEQMPSSKSELNMKDIAAMAPILKMPLVQAYIGIPADSAQRNQIKSTLKIYITSVVTALLPTQNAHNVINQLLQLFDLKVMTFPASASISAVKAYAKKPNLKPERKNRLYVDVAAVISANWQNNMALINEIPVQRFTFVPGSRIVRHSEPLITSVIQCMVNLQNHSDRKACENNIEPSRFIDIEITKQK